jgi:hypothetical protein
VQGIQRGQKTPRARGGGSEKRKQKKKVTKNIEFEVILATRVPDLSLSKEVNFYDSYFLSLLFTFYLVEACEVNSLRVILGK